MDGHYKELADYVIESLGSKVAVSNDVQPKSPVSDYWDKGYQAVVLYHNPPIIPDYQGKLWGARWITSPWPEANDAEELRSKLEENVEKQHGGRFFVLQGILTPDVELIKEEILDSGGVSIKSIALDCNCKVVDWVDGDFQKKSLNVVIIDFFEICSLLPCVVDSNRKK